jgi:hypothetical protein
VPSTFDESIDQCSDTGSGEQSTNYTKEYGAGDSFKVSAASKSETHQNDAQESTNKTESASVPDNGKGNGKKSEKEKDNGNTKDTLSIQSRLGVSRREKCLGETNESTGDTGSASTCASEGASDSASDRDNAGDGDGRSNGASDSHPCKLVEVTYLWRLPPLPEPPTREQRDPYPYRRKRSLPAGGIEA